MKYLYLLTLAVILVSPVVSRANENEVSLILTKFEIVTFKGGDYTPDQKRIQINWDLQTSLPQAMNLGIVVVNTSTNISTPIINPCVNSDSTSDCYNFDPILNEYSGFSWPIPSTLSPGNYKAIIRLVDRKTGLESARVESQGVINIKSDNEPVESTNPRITSFTQVQSTEYGGSIKIEWEAADTDKVNFVLTGPNFGHISGLNIINAKTGEDFPGVTMFFDAKGSLYLKIINATSLPKKIWAVIDPQSNKVGETINGRKTLEINIPASEISPVVKTLSPASGPIGTVVTIYGSGFTKTGNWVSLETTGNNSSGLQQWNVESADGKTLKFIVPDTLKQTSEAYAGYRAISVVAGKYQISVSNDAGKSEVYYFNVTSKAPLSEQNIPSGGSGTVDKNLIHTQLESESGAKGNVDVDTKSNQPNNIETDSLIDINSNNNDSEAGSEIKVSFIQRVFKFIFGWLK